MNLWKFKTIFKEPTTLLPFKYYYLPMLIIAVAGLADALYLSVSHYRVYTDMGYRSFCAVSKSINCDTVSQSVYSILLGVPVPVWGMFGYALFLFLLILAGFQKDPKSRIWPLLFWLACLFSAYSIFLAVISTFLIHSYCLMCIVSYMINFMLMYYAWFINKRFGNDGLIRGFVNDLKYLLNLKKITVPILTLFLVSGCAMVYWFPEYWHLKPAELSQHIPRGVTDDGHPWIGAENPELTIEEYSDYLCFYCRKMHYYLRTIIEANPDKIRLVHYHFPMDHQFNPIVTEPFHVGSGFLAMLAIHASDHDKFWEANDMFLSFNLESGKLNIAEIASSLNLDEKEMLHALNDPTILTRLREDIIKGLKLGITGTPGFVIDGILYQGQIPPNVLKRFIR
jgi:uncharacterized membrane protein/protein-disulfide isomerase